MTIKDFRTVEDLDVASLGGKAESLIRLIKNKFLVPSGFVILSDTFDRVLKLNGLDVVINDLILGIDPCDVKAIETAAAEIQTRIRNIDIPTDIHNEIIRQYEALGSEFVAVRSSATAEDSKSAAWAGQLESYTNVVEDVLLERVKDCWASLFSPRAIAYRVENDMLNIPIGIAVVVQDMVESEVSGIAFSLNPLDNNKDYIFIESAFGLCEAIVSGQIIPDGYLVHKNDLSIDKKKIVNQEKVVQRGGWHDVDSDIQGVQKLTDNQIREVAENIVKIEKLYGFPVDIEFSYSKNQLYILQARPITTLGEGRYSSGDSELIEYIKSQSWGCFKNTKRKLFFSSMWVMGAREKMHSIDAEVVANEDIDVNTIPGLVLRVFNLNQPQLTDDIVAKHAPDPCAILKYIENNNALVYRADEIVQEIAEALVYKDYNRVCSGAVRFIDIYAEASTYEYFINGLARGIYKKLDTEYIDEITPQVNHWRDDERINHAANVLRDALQFVVDTMNMQLTVEDMFNYLHVDEVIKIFEGNFSEEEIADMISSRAKYGYILLNLRGDRYKNKVLDYRNKKEVREIEKIIYTTYRNTIEQNIVDGTCISGQSVCVRKDIIRGECIVIPQEEDLSSEREIDGKILVTTMTTPEFVPYIRNARGVITDNGGIMCHAAIIAREFGIPCIIGTEGATAFLKTGDIVDMDIEKGTIALV